uniref:Uncharacterized protein n=1 Tax=Eutreptiella gymnastica TaxID=73025 RepID=A0A7S1NAV3_9EUGL
MSVSEIAQNVTSMLILAPDTGAQHNKIPEQKQNAWHTSMGTPQALLVEVIGLVWDDESLEHICSRVVHPQDLSLRATDCTISTASVRFASTERGKGKPGVVSFSFNRELRLNLTWAPGKDLSSWPMD